MPNGAIHHTGLNTFAPGNFAVDRFGFCYFVNGIERGRLLDVLAGTTHELGIDAPSSGPTVASPAGGGATAGTYYVAVRFVDKFGRVSNLSPLVSHVAALNDQFNYTAIPVSSQVRVTKRQIWRSTVDQSKTLYFIAEINDNATTVLSGSDLSSDSTLQTAAIADATKVLPIIDSVGDLIANRFTPPPTHKAVMVIYQDRAFWLVDVIYTAGTIAVNNASTTVTGTGTAWTSDMAGRAFSVFTGPKEYVISSVNVGAQTLTLAENYTGSNISGSAYSIRPVITERRKMYFSEQDEPESAGGAIGTSATGIPLTANTYTIQENFNQQDELTGAIPQGTIMYILSERHIYRFFFFRQPKIDAQCVPAISRGCLNQRCWDFVEGMGYFIDQTGIYRWSGGQPDDIGFRIQNKFRDGTIDLTQAKWFWVKGFPGERVVRFGVSYSGQTRPKQAFCYSYATGTWWEERYAMEIGFADVADIASRPRLIFGMQNEQVLLTDEGTLDVTLGSGTVRGTATAASSTTITDGAATFPTDVVNASIAIVAGTAKGQIARITVRNGPTQVTFTPAMSPAPAVGDTYLIGAVEYSLKTGQFKMLREEQDNERQIRLAYQPTTNAATIDARKFYDHGSTPENNERTQADQGDGWAYTKGNPDAVGNLISTRSSLGAATGFLRLGFSGVLWDDAQTNRWMYLHLRGFQGQDQIKLEGLELYGFEAAV